jgi:glycosyltransferase involved in cell wall biosynthesis
VSRPKFSVIMPAYQHAAFVGAALDSVFSQTLRNIELIVGDDGSTDGTRTVIHQRASKAPIPVKVIDAGHHRGASAVMNDLWNAASGEYVAVLNSDDAFHPEKLARQLAFMEERPHLTASFTWVEVVNESGETLSQTSYPGSLFDQPNRPRTEWLRKLFFEGNCLCHPTLLARRKNFRFRLDTRLCKLPDYELWTRLLAAGEEIAILPERLTKFRILDKRSNASGKTPATMTLIEHEFPLVLDNYTTLSEEDCLAVFGETGNAHVRKFVAYRRALSLCRSAQNWGIRGIYSLLGEPESRRALHKSGFSETALYALAAQYDVFCELPDRMKLYFAGSAQLIKTRELLSAFSEERTSSCPVLKGYFKAHFPIGEPVAALRFDPAEYPCRVRLKRAAIVLASGRELELTHFFHHNGRDEPDCVVFDHDDPWFICLLTMEVWALEAVFEGEWE